MDINGGKIKPITAALIVGLLNERHRAEFCVNECKVGGTYSHAHVPRMDFWVAHNTWRSCRATGYEIKVSRQDFIGDDKWPGYLPFCNEFYFVCPRHIIAVSELPPEAGLMWVNPGATNVYIKKKAPTRLIKINPDVYHYALMWRAETEESRRADRMRIMGAWAGEKSARMSLDLRLKESIRRHISGADNVYREAAAIKGSVEQLVAEVNRLTGMALNHHNCRQIAGRLVAGNNPEVASMIRSAVSQLQEAQNLLGQKTD